MELTDAISDFTTDRMLSNLALSSLKGYSLVLGAFSRYLHAQGVHDSRSITLAPVRSYLAQRKGLCKQSTVSTERSILHLFVRWLYEHHECAVDPATMPSVAAPKADELRRIHIPMHEVLLMFARLRRVVRERRDCKSLSDLLLLSLLFGVGLRIGEVATVRRKDVDLHTREIFLPHTKSSCPRHVAIPRSVLPILRLAFRYKHDYLFTARHGGPYRPTTLARRIVKLAADCGITLTSHTGRRYCITKLAAVSLSAAQQQAGHKNVETTLQYLPENRVLLHEVVGRCDPLS